MNIQWECPLCDGDNMSYIPVDVSLVNVTAECVDCEGQVRFIGDNCAPVSIEED